MTRKWAPLTRYTLRRNTASIMKGLVWFFLVFVIAVLNTHLSFSPDPDVVQPQRYTKRLRFMLFL